MAHPLTDKRSRLYRRVQVIEKGLRREYQINRPLWRDRVRMAARYTALAEQMLAKHGVDVGAFPARAAKLQGSADRLLRMVPLKPRVDRHDLASVLAREAKR